MECEASLPIMGLRLWSGGLLSGGGAAADDEKIFERRSQSAVGSFRSRELHGPTGFLKKLIGYLFFTKNGSTFLPLSLERMGPARNCGYFHFLCSTVPKWRLRYG